MRKRKQWRKGRKRLKQEWLPSNVELYLCFLTYFNECSLLYPLKTSENWRFSDNFRVYRKRLVTWNGLIWRRVCQLNNLIYTKYEADSYCCSGPLQEKCWNGKEVKKFLKLWRWWNVTYSFRAPIPVFDWLIFCCKNLIFHQKKKWKWKKKHTHTIFIMKNKNMPKT